MRFVTAAVGVGLFLALGCGGAADVRHDVNDKLREEARQKFVDACSRAGRDGNPVSRDACTCVADEVLVTHTTKELLKFAADPAAKELVPILESCVKKLTR